MSTTLPNVFRKKKGTGDQGGTYEELMVTYTCIKLTLDENVEDFKISSNDEQFGSFDDLVVSTRYTNGNLENYAVQLKHSSGRNKTIATKDLESKNDFSVLKYFLSKLPKNFTCILHTNRQPNFANNPTLYLKYGREEHETLTAEIHEESSNIHKFTIDINKNPEIPDEVFEKWASFFGNFLLRTDQDDVAGLQKRALNLFTKHLQCKEHDFVKFQEFIRRWNGKEGKKDRLTKETIRLKLVECLLSPFIKTVSDSCTSENNLTLRKAILNFDLTIFEDANEIVDKIWIKTKSEEEINKAGRKYFLISEDVRFMGDDLKSEACTKILWYLEEVPLIIEVGEESLSVACKAIELLKNVKRKKLVLLNYRLGLNNAHFRCLWDLKSKDLGSYEKILKNFQCTLQGKQCKLKEIVDDDVARIITTDLLFKISNNNFDIGCPKDNLPECYIRRILPKIIVNSDFVTEENSDNWIVISCRAEEIEQIRKKFINIIDGKTLFGDRKSRRSDDLIRQLQKNSKKIYINHAEADEFLSIHIKKDYHHFRYLKDNLEWIASKSNIDDLKPFLLNSEEFQTEEELLQNSQEINLICGGAGFGKSTLLQFLKNSCSVENFAISINSKEKSKDLTSLLRRRDEFENKFIQILFIKKRIVFFWDNLHEMETKQVFSLLHEIQTAGFVQWIFIGPPLQSTLESKFNIFARNMVKFDEKQQKKYMEERLGTIYNKEQIAIILEKISENSEFLEAHSILGVPAKLSMLMELFLQNLQQNICNHPLTVTNLFHYFTETKFETYFLQLKLKDNFSINVIKNERQKKCELLAIKLSLDSVDFLTDSEKSTLGQALTEADPLGFVVKINENVAFVHQTYMEYFAALFLARNYRRIPNFQQIYFDAKFRNTIFIFDLILGQDKATFNAVLYKNVEILEQRNEDLMKKDLAGRNLLHLAMFWGQEDAILPELIPGRSYSKTSKMMEVISYLLKFLAKKKSKHIFDGNDELFMANCFSYSQGSALHLAVLTNDLGIVKAVFKRCQSINCRNNNNDTPLMHAAFIGSLEIAKFLISKGANVNVSNTSQNGPLHYSVLKHGNCNVVKLLLEKGVDVNSANSQGFHPLHYAVLNNRFEIVELLLENNPNIDCVGNNGWTPLMIASSKGFLRIAKRLIANSAYVNRANFEAYTALQIAVVRNRISIVNLLIEEGAELNCFDRNSFTPLMYAAFKGHCDIAEKLLTFGADPNMTDVEGNCALSIAIINGNQNVADLLLSHKATKINYYDSFGCTPLISAALKGNLDIAKKLIERQANVNIANVDGIGPLAAAVMRNNFEIVEFLLEQGAEVNSRDEMELTPLMYAAFEGHFEIVKLLRLKGADLNLANIHLETSLNIAACNNHVKIVKFLLEEKADLDICNKSGWTPLMSAVSEGFFDIAEILLDAGASVNMVNDKGRSALHLAVLRNDFKLVKLLIDESANINCRDKYGNTPLMYSLKIGNFELFQFLIANNADVNKVNVSGDNLLHIAAESNYLETVSFLVEKGVKINHKNKSGITPLALAASKGFDDIVKYLVKNGARVDHALTPAVDNNHVDIAKYLLEKNAHVNSYGKSGWSPLMHAAARGYLEMAICLISYGADVNCEDIDGNSALHIAVFNNQEKIVDLLLEKNVDVELEDANGRTPLMIAVQKGNLAITKRLVKEGVAVNSQDFHNGQTALHLAVCEKHTEIVQFLIENKAALNLKDKFGNTALHCAVVSGSDISLVKILFENGADVNVTNNEGCTAWDLEGSEEVLNYLRSKSMLGNGKKTFCQFVVEKIKCW